MPSSAISVEPPEVRYVTSNGRPPIRVMQIAPEMGVGGIPHVVETLCRTINRELFDVSLLCINSAGAAADHIRAGGHDVFLADTAGRARRYLAFYSIAKILRTQRIDVIHTHNTQAFIDGTIAAKLAGVRGIIHSDHAREFPDKLRYMVAERWASHFAHRVVGVSDHTSASLIEYVRIARDKVVTIPNGITGDRFSRRIDAPAKRAEMGIAPGRPVLGIGARLVAQKAHADLLTAVGLLREKHPDVLLLIAGEGDLEGEIRREIVERRLEHNVWMLGVRHDMDELLQVIDVYVMPSLWEGLPMALLEAMAAGCAVVASHVGGVPTAIMNDVNGTTVPPMDPAALAAAVTQLLDEPERRARYAAKGRELFRSRFSAEMMTGAYEELYVRATHDLRGAS